ncbi:hypothetical protein SBRY_40132 [Actinacidiphila bryophytorum]|uniref:Uncharacterized protein n=1 Tax=Actinacidiphila bryophytorum TaxID=1436133 RepID=A0A9W4H267_9ACTN|nr:hypothetical protein SBRY_40132 [Actinacidiphila bryophytorum]
MGTCPVAGVPHALGGQPADARHRRAGLPRGAGLGRVLEVPPAPRRLARTLAALSESSE